MEQPIKQHLEQLHNKDRHIQGNAFEQLMELTDQPVDWAYEVWDELIHLLQKGDNRMRSIAAQLLCNLAKSDPAQRMADDLEQLLAATKDAQFVTARHSLLALWKVGIMNKTLQNKVVEGVSKRYEESVAEKNGTLIRYDCIGVLRKIYDLVQDDTIQERVVTLLSKETSEKYRKKYRSLWQDVLKKEKIA